MKIPKSFLDKKNILLASVTAAIVIGTVGGGLYFSNKKEKENQQNPETTTEEGKKVDEDFSVGGNKPNQTPNTNENGTTSDTPTTNTPKSNELADVSIQGTLLKDENNAVSTILYGDAGTYTIEKKSGETWVSVLNNTNYSGRGGLDLQDQIPVSETERTYRVYRLVDGSKIGPKEILVDRNLVVSKGGVTNFPGAL